VTRRWFDWRLMVAMTILLIVGAFCFNSIKATERAEEYADQNARSTALIEGLQATVDKQARQLAERDRKARANATRIQQQNRVQRRQIDLLVRYLRKNGLDVPRIALTPSSPRRATGSTSPNLTVTPPADQPGKSDGHRKNPRKSKKVR